jgi:hypothetical protein
MALASLNRVFHRFRLSLEVGQLRRSIALLSPGARDAVGPKDALRLLTELGDVLEVAAQGPTGTIGLVPQEIWALTQLVTR